MAAHIERWVKGLQNGSDYVPRGKFVPPSMYTLANCMNRKWTFSKGEYNSIPFPNFGVQDAYAFLFDEMSTIDRFCRYFSDNIGLMIIRGHALERTPYEINFYVPLRNLILHKLGYIHGENGMNHWAFFLGKIFKESNWIYRQFFQRRGSNIPVTLIGQKYAEQAYVNPSLAFSQFTKAFHPAYVWAENHGVYLGRYKELVQQLTAACEGKIPTSVKSEDRLLLTAGYTEIKRKETPEEKEA
jgi:hypothetical protein